MYILLYYLLLDEIERDVDKEIKYNYGNQLSSCSINWFSKNLHYLSNLQSLNLNSIYYHLYIYLR